jgi:hypothetical protein
MDEVKPFYMSKGVIGALVVLIGVIVQALGYTWGPDDQQVAVTLISTGLEAIGGLVALWGRVNATKQVKLKVPPAPPAAAVLVLLCVGLIVGIGCASNTKTIKLGPDGKPVEIAYDMTDSATYHDRQAELKKAALENQKPLSTLVIPKGATLKAEGGDIRIETYAPPLEVLLALRQYEEPIIRGLRENGGIVGLLGTMYALGWGPNNKPQGGGTHYNHSFNGNENSPMAVGNGNGWSMPTNITNTTQNTSGPQSPIGNGNWAGPRDNITNPAPEPSPGE